MGIICRAASKPFPGLGFAYSALAERLDRAKNLKQAIACWEESMLVNYIAGSP
jgi:hypothetical protein